MKTILRFEFDSPVFYPEYEGPRNIIFENPSHVPATGDAVDFDVTAFFEDSRLRSAFQDLTEGRLLYAERLSTLYSIDTVEVLVVVYDEQTFKENYPQYFGVSVV